MYFFLLFTYASTAGGYAAVMKGLKWLLLLEHLMLQNLTGKIQTGTDKTGTKLLTLTLGSKGPSFDVPGFDETPYVYFLA